jgi:PIN domain nuclease of toxin-antitoxin system
MTCLLDTHAFLWFILDDERLSAVAAKAIAESETVFISPASYWEIAIKISLGKYELQEPFEVFMDREIGQNDFTVLPISVRHAAFLTDLPLLHRDPFDRLIVAQAIAEAIPLISGDKALDAYEIRRIW